MATAHGRRTYISVDGTDITAYVDSSDFARTQDTADETAYGPDDKEYLGGHEDATFNASGKFDPTVDTVLAGVLDGETVEIIWGPAGDGSGMPRYTSDFLVTNYQVSAPVADKVSWSASFQRTGPTTRDSFSS